MLFGIARFELRYQLRNPVFWASTAIFFLLTFGAAASENVQIGTPGQVHENAPFAIASITALMGLFYLFVVTAFVANAIVRDDATGFAPIVRATSVTRSQFVLGRFLGGLGAALVGYLAVPLGTLIGSSMPWVDPETVGPQVFSYYAWNFLVFGVPNVLLTSALLFTVATQLRSMMASYIAAVVLVMGYLVTINLAGQNIEYRDLFARFELLGNGALAQATRYWTQAELNGRLVSLEGDLLFNRLFAIGLSFLLVLFATWRFSMTDRAPSKRKLRALAKAEVRSAQIAAVPPALDGGRVVARTADVSRWTQFALRLRVEMRQVLTSPGLIVLTLFAMGMAATSLWLGEKIYGTPPHATLAAEIDDIRAGFSAVLLMIAGFYGGELVWRERDRHVNELIDSTAVPAWVMTVPKIVAIFFVLLLVNCAALVVGILFQVTRAAVRSALPSISAGSSCPPRSMAC
jgi:ABC-2 type transport system permease protein